MGIIDRLFGKKSTLFPERRFTVIGGKVVPVGSDLSSNITDGYEAISTIYSMVKIMTDKAGAIPRYMYSVNSVDTRKKALKIKQPSIQAMMRKAMLTKKMEDLDQHEFLEVLKRSGGSQFIKQMLGYRYITGNCYVRINSGQQPGTPPTARPVELQILPAQYIDITADVSDPWTPTGYILNGGGQRVDFHKDEIIHFKYPTYSWDGGSMCHLYGMSPLKPANPDITTAKYLKQAQASMAQNEGAKGILVRNDDFELEEGQRDAIQDRVDQELNRSVNRGRVIVTNANVRWEQLGMSAAELDLVKTFQLGKEELANIYNFPIHILSSVTSTFNNVDAAIKYLTTNTIWGDLMDSQDMFNQFIERFWGKGFVFMYDISDMPELADDYNKMAQSLKDLYWISPNEKRGVMKYDDNTDKNMDEIIVPSGYVPLEFVFKDPFAMPTNTNVSNDYNNGSGKTSD